MTIVQGVLKVPSTTEGKKPAETEKRVEVTPGKSHYGLYIAIMAVLMAMIVIGVVVFMAAQTPAKTVQSTVPEVKTSVENPTVDAATGAVVIDSSPLLARWGPLMSVDNIPAEVKLPSSENLYLTNLRISSTKISGYVENRGTNREWVVDNIILVSAEGYGGASLALRFPDGINEIAPSKSRYFEIVETRENALSKQQAKFFKFEHG